MDWIAPAHIITIGSNPTSEFATLRTASGELAFSLQPRLRSMLAKQEMNEFATSPGAW
jgi:hypothetical protein